MATTTNYGWTTPDDTSLVKDGAAAIRTLGSSVDTTTKALNPSTTLGDVEYRSATANTNTRLGIGTTGQVLTVTGGVPVWATPAGGGGMTLLSTTTLSGASTTISSIDQTYVNLAIYIVNVTQSTNSKIRFAVNGTPSIIVAGASAFGVSPTLALRGRNENNLETNWDPSGGSADFAAILEIDRYSVSTSRKTVRMGMTYLPNSGDRVAENLAGGIYSANTAVNSLTITSASSSFTGGSVLIYGVK